VGLIMLKELAALLQIIDHLVALHIKIALLNLALIQAQTHTINHLLFVLTTLATVVRIHIPKILLIPNMIADLTRIILFPELLSLKSALQLQCQLAGLVCILLEKTSKNKV